MVRMKPAALLLQSKKKKGVTKVNVAGIGCVVLAVLLLAVGLTIFRRRIASLQHVTGSSIMDAASKAAAQLQGEKAGGNTSTLPSHVVLHTSKGDIHLELFPQEAPKAVENFVTHSKAGYYNNVSFHRVIKGFMIQGGDPGGDGTGGKSIWGVPFADEISESRKHGAFALSMANSGPDSNGSQFFVTTVATPHLDGKHTVFGRVTAGREVVQAIESVPTGANDKPETPVTITAVTVGA